MARLKVKVRLNVQDELNKFMNKPLYYNPIEYNSVVYNTGNDKKVVNDYFVIYKIAVKIRKKNLKGSKI